MAARPMRVTTGFPDLSCGRAEPIHSGADLSTPSVHPSYTEPWAGPPATTGFVHSIHRPYYNDETYRDGFGPEYLGKKATPQQTPGEGT